jgi:hypothetical protein
MPAKAVGAIATLSHRSGGHCAVPRVRRRVHLLAAFVRVVLVLDELGFSGNRRRVGTHDRGERDREARDY